MHTPPPPLLLPCDVGTWGVFSPKPFYNCTYALKNKKTLWNESGAVFTGVNPCFGDTLCGFSAGQFVAVVKRVKARGARYGAPPGSSRGDALLGTSDNDDVLTLAHPSEI